MCAGNIQYSSSKLIHADLIHVMKVDRAAKFTFNAMVKVLLNVQKKKINLFETEKRIQTSIL